jgi:hypothetical protein
MIHRLLCTTALAALLPAQQTKVLPKGMDFVEGPAVLTFPFNSGNPTCGIQLLINAGEITQGVAVITGFWFRPTQQTQTTVAFSKPYQVTAYTVAMNAANFEAMPSPYDPTTVLGGATPTLVFSGSVSVPATTPLQLTPAPFSIHVAFSTPYLFDSSQGNLVLMFESTDNTTIPNTARVDAVTLSETATTGIVAPIDTQGCIVLGRSLTSSTSAASAVLGGTLSTQLTASPPGSLPAAFVVLAFDRADTDLAILGMTPGCMARIAGTFMDSIVIDLGSGLPPVLWGIPLDPNLLGAAAITQAVGLAPSGLLGDSVISNAEAIRVGDSGPAGKTMMVGFHSVTSTTNLWAHGTTGMNTPVVQLEGVFP